MSIHERINRLHRRLRPAALEGEWLRFLEALNTRYRSRGLFGDEPPWSDAELRAMAREAAATGLRPGVLLAAALERQAAAG